MRQAQIMTHFSTIPTFKTKISLFNNVNKMPKKIFQKMYITFETEFQ